MIKFFIKIWRYFFPLPITKIDFVAADPRFKDEPNGDWNKMRRVYCPACGSPVQMIGEGKIDDKVRCARECGMKGYFDGVYVKWNHVFTDRN